MKKKRNKGLLLTIVALVSTVCILGMYSMKDNNEAAASPGVETDKPYIGLLQYASHPSLDAIADGIINTLAEKGYMDGDTMTLDIQNAQGDQSNLNTMGARFIANDADLMIAIATPAALSLANASSEVPIILGAITDPEHVGLVESNEVPGGNVTGVSDMTPIAQQLALIRQIQPEATTLGLLYSSSEDNSVLQGEMAKELAGEYGFETITRTVVSTNDVAQVSQQLVSEVDAIWIPNDNVVASAFPSVLEVSNGASIPVYPAVDMMVAQGGLATLGLNQYQIGVKTGEIAVGVLEGKIDPASASIRLADETDLVINFETADRLGIHIPDGLRFEAVDARELLEED